MKKRLTGLLIICMLVISMAGCGKNDSNAGGGFLANIGKESKNLTIGSLEERMIESAYYSETDGCNVLCGFIGLSDGQGICILAVSENGAAPKVVAGKYEPTGRVDGDGMEISSISFNDAFTGVETTLGFVQPTANVSDNTADTDACVITADNSVYDLYKTSASDFINRIRNFNISSYSSEMVITTWME